MAFKYTILRYPDPPDTYPPPGFSYETHRDSKLAEEMSALGEQGFRFAGTFDAPNGNLIVMELEVNDAG